MFVPITDQSRVYIVAPANLATGGPELLHQLAYKLNQRNIFALMLYLPTDHPDPVNINYRHYGIEYVQAVEDEQEHVLIVPETMTDFLGRFKKIRKAVWWLSIDNYFTEQETQCGRINRWLLSKFGSQSYLGFDRQLKSVDYHFYQSEYAKQRLQNLGVENVASLSDYLSQEFLQINTNLGDKQNIVAFNPKKGRRFTKKIIKKSSGIDFVPIINMNRDEVIALLQNAKVYIDFGHHPGKDRIPREACMLGCCVITSKKGSARFQKDVPIKEAYKFRDTVINVPKIAKKIRECFDQFVENYHDFDQYRTLIKAQEQLFDREIDNIFRKISDR